MPSVLAKASSTSKGKVTKPVTTTNKDAVAKKVNKGNESSNASETKSSAKGDARFASFATDPRFRSSANVKGNGAGKKIAVDKRFKAMFEDDEFRPSKAKVDKYGRKLSSTKKDSFGDMSRHYTLTEDEETRLDELNKIARGEVAQSSSEDDEDDDDMSELEAEEDDQDGEVAGGKEELLPTELGKESSRRLAVVGCDWDHIRAVDVLAVLRSFIPPTGAVLDVAVYSSEFGRKRMAEEEVEGPFASKTGNHEDNEEDGEDEEDVNGVTDAGAGYDPELLRKYEKERLLYYFAVVTCDSVATAEVLYRECDGLEFEKSSVGLDLRFVPDDVKFDAKTLRDRASDVPETYAPIDFVNKSLQQTRVELTWDEPEHDRRKLMEWGSMVETKKKDPKAKGVPIEELEAFIASDQSDVEDSEDEEEKRKQDIQRYRNLLLKSSSTKTTNDNDDEEEQEEEEGDFFVDEDEEEEVSAKKAKSSKRPEEPAGEDEDSAKAKDKKQKKRKPLFVEEDQLGLDDAKSKNTSKKKKKDTKDRSSAKLEEDEEDVNVELNVKDERFASLFTEPEYAFDRTDPRFKSTETTRKIEEERRKRMQNKQGR